MWCTVALASVPVVVVLPGECLAWVTADAVAAAAPVTVEADEANVDRSACVSVNTAAAVAAVMLGPGYA